MKTKSDARSWIQFAVNNAGGPAAVAKKLALSERVVVAWLRKGLDREPFLLVQALADIGRIPVETFVRTDHAAAAWRGREN